MTVVFNMSPMRYLIAAGHADLLAQLFGTICVPAAVEATCCTVKLTTGGSKVRVKTKATESIAYERDPVRNR
jgi:predicted nucleic acid-binding protein